VTEVFSVSELAPEVRQTEPETALPLTVLARLFLAVVCVLGLAVLAQTAIFWRSPDLIKFGAFLAVSLFSAGARVRVPGVSAPLSLSYLFVLLSLVELSTPETILLATCVAVMQCYWHPPERPRVKTIPSTTASKAIAPATARSGRRFFMTPGR